jgi:RNA polymerase sigma-70 factor (ECF subfamily)
VTTGPKDQAITDAGTLYRRHASFVTGFLKRLGLPGRDIEDAVQEVFLIAHRRGGFVPETARPTTWLAEIALRVFWKRRRNIARDAPVDDAAVAMTPSREPGPAEAAVTRESLVLVERALATLELDRRAIFILFELEGESCESIAAGLGIPVGTVHSRLHTARQAFLRAYERFARTTVTVAQSNRSGTAP